MLYQHPLAYLLGLEGVALLHAFAGEHDRAFVEERFDEIRQLLESRDRFGDGTTIPAITTTEGYRRWAADYDAPGNGLIDVEQPIVREILDGIPVGTALDAACGTGRHTEYLVELGHRVLAVDASPECCRSLAPGSRRPSSTRPTCTTCRCRTTASTSSSARSRSPTSRICTRHWRS